VVEGLQCLPLELSCQTFQNLLLGGWGEGGGEDYSLRQFNLKEKGT